jgi:hypothetical protein
MTRSVLLLPMIGSMLAFAGEPAAKGWQRTAFQPGGGKARLQYVVYGRFPADAKLERPGYCGALLQLPVQVPEAASSAPSCVSVRSEVADPASLEYLRDALLKVTSLLDAGGVAAYDVSTGIWRTAAVWRSTFAEPMHFRLEDHVELKVRAERDLKGVWARTVGMHKFGRPEITMHHAPRDQPAWGELVLQIAGSMADGMIYPTKATTVRSKNAIIKEFTIEQRHDPEFDDDRLYVSP